MLYHPSTQNLPSNPLSSTQALSAAEENTKSLLKKPFSSWAPSHRRYAYLLPGWCLFPIPHSWYFKPSVAQGEEKGAEWALPNFLPFSSGLPNSTLPFSIKGQCVHLNIHRYCTAPRWYHVSRDLPVLWLANCFPSAHKHTQERERALLSLLMQPLLSAQFEESWETYTPM